MATVVDDEDGSVYDDEAEIFSPRVISTKNRGFDTKRSDHKPLSSIFASGWITPEIKDGENS